MAKRHTEAPTKYDGQLSEYKTKYLRCRGRRRHTMKLRGHINIVQKGERILEFTEELYCVCGVRSETDYEVHPVTGRFVRKGAPRMDYSGAPGYLFDSGNKYDLEESRDELLTRELMGSLTGDALQALFNTKGVGIASRKTYLRVV